MACPLPVAAVSQVAVGCPPGRHIRLRIDTVADEPGCRPEAGGETGADCPCSAYRDPARAPMGYSANYSRFGCPYRKLYTELLLPKVELWDFDTFVRDVTAPFVVRELRGQRAAYTYRNTLAKAGCTRAATPWPDRIAAAGAHWTNASFWEWIEANGESCHGDGDGDGDGDGEHGEHGE